LPGSAQSIKEPRRTAVGLLYEIFGDAVFDVNELAPVAAFDDAERAILRQMLSKGINSPRTTSVGRLFDAVASIVNLRQRVSFEGQAAMELEFAIQGEETNSAYDYLVEPSRSEVLAPTGGVVFNGGGSIVAVDSRYTEAWHFKRMR
jgi:hydrogenase maturation protein HypF